uniref:Uncharacterized protein n=1 Tax=Oryza nivara TaxID=4536 RepID=A0A0E0IBD9_ORYNI
TKKPPWKLYTRGLKPRRQTVGRKTRHNLILRSKCRSSHPTPQRVQWSEPHYSLDLHKHAAHNRTTSFISIQGANVDPDGYAKAAGNLKAQGKT